MEAPRAEPVVPLQSASAKALADIRRSAFLPGQSPGSPAPRRMEGIAVMMVGILSSSWAFGGVPPSWNQLLEAHGGKSLKECGSFMIQKRWSGAYEATLTIWSQGDKRLSITKTGAGEFVMLTVGRTAWQRDENGYVRPVEPIEQADFLLRETMMDAPLALTLKRGTQSLTLRASLGPSFE